MRAGTLFGLTVALVLGLGAAAGAKYMGFLDKKVEPAPAPTVVAEPPIKVLVAGTNLFKGLATSSNDVRLRDLRPDEKEAYLSARKEFLPPSLGAANFRVLKENIPADTVLKESHFEPQGFDNVGTRIDPYMRAVNISVGKQHAAGGVIRTGERVDVFLKSRIADGSDNSPILRSAMIARDLKVIAKRDNLLDILATNPDDKPLSFTVQANPYRAALIEYAQAHGQITLVPRPEVKGFMDGGSGIVDGTPNFSDPESKEYREENERVIKLEKGEYQIGALDLERIFGLPPIEPPPPPSIVRVVNISGVNKVGETVFGSESTKPVPVAYAFSDPTTLLTPPKSRRTQLTETGGRESGGTKNIGTSNTGG